ncbi:MAG: SRPBCC domain-containing protein [Balneolaceae bacterium]
MITHKTDVQSKGRKLILTRDFDAPPELVFDVWSSCKHLKNWWGPKEWPMDECMLDFREGGEWRYCLRGPNKEDESWGKAIYQEINKPGKIVYKDHFTDNDGNINEEMPELLVTVEFDENEGKTRQIQTVLFDTAETRDKIVEMGFIEGMSSSLDRLEEHLAAIK